MYLFVCPHIACQNIFCRCVCLCVCVCVYFCLSYYMPQNVCLIVYFILGCQHFLHKYLLIIACVSVCVCVCVSKFKRLIVYTHKGAYFFVSNSVSHIVCVPNFVCHIFVHIFGVKNWCVILCVVFCQSKCFSKYMCVKLYVSNCYSDIVFVFFSDLYA